MLHYHIEAHRSYLYVALVGKTMCFYMVGPDRFELSIDGLKVRCDTASPRSLTFCFLLRALLLLRCEPAFLLLASTANILRGFITISLLKIWPGVRESNPRLKIRSLLYFPLYERQQFGSRSGLRSLPFQPVRPVSRVYKSRPHSSAICCWGIIRVSISCYRLHKPGCCHYTNDTIEWCEVKESNL
jgi:hypothetical protein